MNDTKYKADERVTELKVRAFEDGNPVDRDQLLVNEVSVQLRINGTPLVDVQCMPHQLDHMAVGFLVSEGLLMDRSELKDVTVDTAEMVADVTADIPGERLESIGDKMKITSGCGRGITIDNVEEVMNCDRPFNLALTVPSNQAMDLGFRFNQNVGLYRDTKAVHSAALSAGQDFDYFAEDLGRHNAVDKVIGAAFMDGLNPAQFILLCTGRFSFDMVAKAARVRVPMVISPAAATREAVLLAKRFHIALCGRVRKKSMIVYSADWRITAATR